MGDSRLVNCKVLLEVKMIRKVLLQSPFNTEGVPTFDISRLDNRFMHIKVCEEDLCEGFLKRLQKFRNKPWMFQPFNAFINEIMVNIIRLF